MSSETIDSPVELDAHRSWRPDAEVSACFLALYRRLLLQSTMANPVRVVGVTSCRRGEGTSTVASRLAYAAADDGEQKVLLVNANQAAAPGRILAIDDQTPGLLNVLRGSHPLDQTLQPSSLENLWLLPAGSVRGERIVEPRKSMQELFALLLLDFSFVVVDMAPFDELGDVSNLATAMDGVVLVIEAECTKRSVARWASSTLTNARLLGAVLNKRQSPE